MFILEKYSDYVLLVLSKVLKIIYGKINHQLLNRIVSIAAEYTERYIEIYGIHGIYGRLLSMITKTLEVLVKRLQRLIFLQ